MIAQNAHPMQFCGLRASATKYPFAFMRCSLSEITFFGQAFAQSPQPLQICSSMVMDAMFLPPSAPRGGAAFCRRPFLYPGRLPIIIAHARRKCNPFPHARADISPQSGKKTPFFQKQPPFRPAAAKDGAKTIAKSRRFVYYIGAMGFKTKIKKSRFILSCIFLTGYAAYTAYALYYYLKFGTVLGILLLCLIGVALALSAVVTFLSYRINLKDAPRPKLHRFIKIAKYSIQLLCSAISLGFILSAVHTANLFSLIMVCVSFPFLLWSIFVNLVVEFFEHKFAGGFGKQFYLPRRKDDDGNEIDMREVIRNVDATRSSVRRKTARERRNAL